MAFSGTDPSSRHLNYLFLYVVVSESLADEGPIHFTEKKKNES